VGSAAVAALRLRAAAVTGANTAHAGLIAHARTLLRHVATPPSAATVSKAHRLLLQGCFQQLLPPDQVRTPEGGVSSQGSHGLVLLTVQAPPVTAA
jgi:hypothetical protein